MKLIIIIQILISLDFLNKIFDEKNWISLSELNIEIIKQFVFFIN